MTAGILKVRQIPRCGCCDAPNPLAMCERCQEPMCDRHFQRLTDFEGAVSYVCTICAEMLATERLQSAAPTVGVA